MTEPIVTRQYISDQAREAAKKTALHGVEPVNPWPEGSEHAKVWKAQFERWLLWASSPESEGSA